jgi:hypothetical protein
VTDECFHQNEVCSRTDRAERFPNAAQRGSSNYMRPVLIMILFLFSTLSYTQTNITKVDKIRTTVEQINKETGYTTRTLENEEFLQQLPDGGGTLTGYFKNKQLVKLVEWIGLSSCVNITEYYLQNNKLIFVFIQGKEFQYVDSLATFNDRQTVTMECRFYYDNPKIIKSVVHGSTRCGGPPLNTWAKTYQDECSRYIKLFKAKAL